MASNYFKKSGLLSINNWNMLKTKAPIFYLASMKKVLLCVIIIILGSAFIQYNFKWFFHTTCRPQPLPETQEKLSEAEIKSVSTQENVGSEVMLQKNMCTCQSMEKRVQVYFLKNYLDASDVQSAVDRRKKEYEHFKRREQMSKVLLASPNSPLGYPIHGVQVMPLYTILLPGLRINVALPNYMRYKKSSRSSVTFVKAQGRRPRAFTWTQNSEVKLQASLGTIDIKLNVPGIAGCQVYGRGEENLTISTKNLNVLNHILNFITYTSTIYSIDSLDIVKFSLGNHLAQIPVSIRQPPIAHLHDPGRERKISSMVTITTKTFLRYDKLRELLRSIRLYYPDIKVIVADDNQETEKIEDPNVEQYFMPYGKGWFAGRNLAVSQVTTKYFLWVDDDFLFTEDTKIEKLMDVLEGTDLDLVGGNVAGNHFSFKLIFEEGGDEGDCLHWRGGSYHAIQGFPNCVLTDGVVNFFLAHTDKILGVGFDPKLNRVAHSEFFIDALGRLRVGSCSHVSVGHQQKKNPTDTKLMGQLKKYNSFRDNTADQVRTKLGLLYFKNKLKCFTKL